MSDLHFLAIGRLHRTAGEMVVALSLHTLG
jgi:hypothetical protein